MRVFLTGATGYIGRAVAQQLISSNHTVFGLARSDRAVEQLTRAGVEPVRGSMSDIETVTRASQAADAVIHTATTNDANAPAADAAVVGAVISGLNGSSKPFLYTSGVWVLGSTGDTVADEETPVRPAPIVAWRPAQETRVLESAKEGIRPVVIRPGMVVGHESGILGDMLAHGREEGAVVYVGPGTNRWTLVHLDDLAALYVLALQSAPAGSLFMATVGDSVPVKDIALEISRAAGVPGSVQSWPLAEARSVMGLVADALCMDQQVSSARAMNTLGWQPHVTNPLSKL